MTERPKTERYGVMVCLQIDRDANALLRKMSPSQRNLGRTLSECIRTEATRRAALDTFWSAPVPVST